MVYYSSNDGADKKINLLYSANDCVDEDGGYENMNCVYVVGIYGKFGD